MRENVVIGTRLKNRIASGDLYPVDHLVLALVDQMAQQLPAAKVYTDPQRQGTTLPAVCVSVYHSNAQRGLGNTLAVEYQIEVFYLAEDSLDAGELCGAISAMMEMPHALTTGIGVFDLLGRSAAADAIEGRAQMLCRAEARLATPDNDILMRILEQGVELNG